MNTKLIFEKYMSIFYKSKKIYNQKIKMKEKTNAK